MSDSATSVGENDKVKISGGFCQIKKRIYNDNPKASWLVRRIITVERRYMEICRTVLAFFTERLFPRLLHADNLIQRV